MNTHSAAEARVDAQRNAARAYEAKIEAEASVNTQSTSEADVWVYVLIHIYIYIYIYIHTHTLYYVHEFMYVCVLQKNTYVLIKYLHMKQK
jgi:hypothetical protein